MIKFSVVNPLTKEWYGVDEDHKMYTDPTKPVSLCLTLDETLKKEGELNEINRQIAQKRKELGLLMETK